MTDDTYSEAYDVGTLLHNLLFSFQKASTQILGDSHEVFYHPTIDLLLKIEEKSKLKLVSADSLEEALNNYSIFLVKAQVMQGFTCLTDKENNLTINVERCVWAKHIHHMLDPKDVVCPWAMIAMAIVQKFKNVRLEEPRTIYSTDGSSTPIKPLRFGFSTEEAKKLAAP